SAILKAPLFFAAQTLYPERFEAITEDEMGKAMVQILRPGLFSSFLSLVYAHRRFNKIVPHQEWESLSKEFVLHMELGFRLGQRCPSIGEAVGTLSCGIRMAALATFLKQDPRAYTGYRNLQKTFSIPFEHERWGCDHAQIASLMLKSFGFPMDFQQIAPAFRISEEPVLGEDLKPFRAAIVVLQSILNETPFSEIDLKQIQIPLSQQDYEAASNSTKDLLDRGSSFRWMFKTSEVEEREE
ncbi:MAG: hypothetical protein KDD64_15950, partial [Bdellovibrionales bacterium]|nr:hypothetical protein [Bdellovibrionales bacterium]